MTFYNKTVQIISIADDGCYECGGGGSTTVDTYHTAESLTKALSYEFAKKDVVKALLDNERFRTALEDQGWCNLEQATKVAEKATLGTQFFIYEPHRYGSVRKVNFDKLSKYDADLLAKEGTVLLCEITKGSLSKLNRKVYSSYLAAQKKIDARKQAAKKGAETRARKRKEKKIAAAKKLLKEAGELDK